MAVYVKNIWIFIEQVDYKPSCGCWIFEKKICIKQEEMRKWRIKSDELKWLIRIRMVYPAL